MVFLSGVPLVLVGGKGRVEMRVNGADARGADRRQREETVLPKARVENALVVVEQTGNQPRDQRRHAEEIAWDGVGEGERREGERKRWRRR